MLFVISALAFFFLYLGSGNVARQILGPTASEDTVEALRVEFGLDRPLVVQYWDWLSSALTGDFGRSWTSGAVVSESLTTRLAVTLSIVIGALIVSAILSVVLGVAAARRGGAVDGTIQIFVMFGYAVPNFLIALLLVVIFAINLGWFKAVGYIPVTTSFTGWLSSVTLPIIALSASAVAAISQQIRGAVLDALSRDYVRTLRSRGLSTNVIVYQHVLRNAGGPALAILALQFVGLIGGAVIIEQVFALPGIGQLSVQATTLGDIPVVMGLVIASAILVVVVNLLIDLAQAALNPKVRLS